MKKILILEDKEIHRKTLIRILEDLEEPVQIFETDNVGKAYQIAMENTINVFLVDIILNTEVRGDVSGLKFIDSIRKSSDYSFTPIIVITSLEDPKMYTYDDLHCYRYVEKPFDKENVKNIIREALKYPQKDKNEEKIFFRNDGVVYAVKRGDITYIEISRKAIQVHTTREVMKMPYMTVKQLLKELDSINFIQCNRGCIINKDYVEYIDSVNRYIKLLEIDEMIEIGRTMKERVLDEFSN